MVEALADKLVSFFIEKRLGVEEKYEIYKDRINSLIYFIISLVSVVIIGLIFNKVIQGIIFLICYILIRKFAFGYKPNSYLVRLSMFIAMLLFTIYISSYDDIITYKSLVMIFSMLSFGAIYMLAPVNDRKKPLKHNIVFKYKIISRLLASIITIITISLLTIYKLHGYSAYMCAALFWSAILLILGTIKNYII